MKELINICPLCCKEVNVDDGYEIVCCSSCVQILLNQTQEQLKRGYDLAVKKQRTKLANLIEKFMEQDDETVSTKRDMDRERISRKTRTPYFQERKISRTRLLDKGRSKIHGEVR